MKNTHVCSIALFVILVFSFLCIDNKKGDLERQEMDIGSRAHPGRGQAQDLPLGLMQKPI